MLDDFINQVKAAGIVGAGGAGFPTAVKLNAKPELIVVNGAECEPLLYVDQLLAAAHTKTLLETLDKVRTILGAKKAIFALKAKYHDAVDNLEKDIKNFPNLSIKILGNYYPAGDEQVLVYEATGRIVPEGGIPLACGVVVVNVETLLNIALALENKPVTEKYVTIAGEVKKPTTFKVPVGISIMELINEAGGFTTDKPVMINGGPMMGKVQHDFDAPIIKTSKGIIVLPSDHMWVLSKMRRNEEMMRVSKTACCHCMLCTDLCPRYLLGHKLHPDKLMRLASYNDTCEKDESATEAFLCCECGICELACIMSLQPWKLNEELKKGMSKAGIKNPHHNVPEKVNEFREFRHYPVNKLVKKIGVEKYLLKNCSIVDYTKKITQLTFPLKQHLGAPSVAVVEQGQTVSKGDLIAAASENALGANIHASMAGQVSVVNDKFIIIKCS